MAKRCTNCGAKRNIMLDTTVTFQVNKSSVDFKTLCLPCLLRSLDLTSLNAPCGIYNMEKGYEVVSEKRDKQLHRTPVHGSGAHKLHQSRSRMARRRAKRDSDI
jgi:hypothetical protein